MSTAIRKVLLQGQRVDGRDRYRTIHTVYYTLSIESKAALINCYTYHAVAICCKVFSLLVFLCYTYLNNRHTIRPIASNADVLPVVHGSAFFERGDTHVLCTATLGSNRMSRRFGVCTCCVCVLLTVITYEQSHTDSNQQRAIG